MKAPIIKTHWLVILLTSLIISSCKKAEEKPSPTPQATLLSRAWQYDEIRVSVDSQSGTAYKKSGTDSDDQTIWTFAKEGTYSQSTGSSQLSGTWKFTDPGMAKLLLTESGSGKSLTADIGQLIANHLEMTFKYDKSSDADALFLVALYAKAAKLDASKGTKFSITYQLIPSHQAMTLRRNYRR